MSSRRYRTSRVSVTAPHYQTSRVSQSFVLERSSVRIPIRRRAITYIALIVLSFPAMSSQIHYSFNPNTGCFIISAAGTKNFEVVCKFELKTGRSFNVCT